ncbi:flavoprotein domain-containing protein [Ditylenchus destructor]|uniref:Flavoprotein domain-containing protein n=1 Tax=Ditylenchus destructor TaxID=166010 RepID=A0AAD4R2Q4_9BILA|nr:flavoprotein domain-containing protein [Ditylenchus destructor]
MGSPWTYLGTLLLIIFIFNEANGHGIFFGMPPPDHNYHHHHHHNHSGSSQRRSPQHPSDFMMFHGSWNNSRKNAAQQPPASIFDKIGMRHHTHGHHSHDHYYQGQRPPSWPQKPPPPKPVAVRPPINPSHKVERKPGKINLLLGITGSLSADRMPSIIKSLQEGYEEILDIKAVATKASLEFFDPNDLEEYGVMVYEDKDMHEGGRFVKRGDPVLLIELGNWADIMLIAPVTGNTIGSIGHNLGYNLLTVIVLNWSPDKKLFWAPSVPKNMWTNSLDTRQNLYKRQNFVEICPTKNGSFAEVSDIAKIVHETIDEEYKNKKSSPAPETSNAPVHARR